MKSAAAGNPPPGDTELAICIAQGDERALEELLRRHTQRLGTTAYAILDSDDLVADVIQDVFVAVWDQRAILATTYNVAGYLHRAVRNRAISVLRHEQVEHRISQQEAADSESKVTHNAAEDTLAAEDVKAQIYAALRHVPPGPREVFLLHWEHDLTYAEIAAALETTPATVRIMMYRATQRLVPRLRRSPLD